MCMTPSPSPPAFSGGVLHLVLPSCGVEQVGLPERPTQAQVGQQASGGDPKGACGRKEPKVGP